MHVTNIIKQNKMSKELSTFVPQLALRISNVYIWISSNEVDETGANYTEWSKLFFVNGHWDSENSLNDDKSDCKMSRKQRLKAL